MSEGVEWALHTCVNLAWVGPDEAVTTARLAALYDLSPTYLNKHLQALSKAGIVSSTSGPRGGFRLARRPEQVSLLDIVLAIEGPEEAFRCEAILRKGPGGSARVDYRRTCAISQAMHRAEQVWRDELASRTVADVLAEVDARFPDAGDGVRVGLAVTSA